jgi:chorismate dehydratase
MTLRVGHIAYANCVPFFHYLAECGFAGETVPGVPSRLNALLAEGRIDLSPSSSIEYGRNGADYLLLPDFSISSRGTVQSVLLFSDRPLEHLSEIPIAVTGESATSINLLHILLKEFFGFTTLAEIRPAGSVEEHIAAGGAGLLIGDRALRASLAGLASQVYDLGELWWKFTGLPFVFALWIVHRRAAQEKRGELILFQEQLHCSLNRALSDPEGTAVRVPDYGWFGQERLVAYWRTMAYDFSEAHRRGLELFFRLAVKHRLLSKMPELQFFDGKPEGRAEEGS